MFSSPTRQIHEAVSVRLEHVHLVFDSDLHWFVGLFVFLFKYENYPASQLKVHDTLLALSRDLQSSIHFTVANLATLSQDLAAFYNSLFKEAIKEKKKNLWHSCFSWERATPPPVKSRGCMGTLLVTF